MPWDSNALRTPATAHAQTLPAIGLGHGPPKRLNNGLRNKKLMSTQIQETFIQSVKESATILTDVGFLHHSTERKGYATYIDYKKNDTLISFMLGPSDWHVEISILTSKRKYGFKDLLEIPSIARWVSDNKFEQTGKDRIMDTTKDEVTWFTRFIRFSVTEI